VVSMNSASAPQIQAEFAHTKAPDRRTLIVERSVVIALVMIPMAGVAVGLELLIKGNVGLPDHLLFAAAMRLTVVGPTREPYGASE